MPNDNILDYYRKRTVYSYKLPYTYRNVRYYYRKRTVMYCTVQFYDTVLYCCNILKMNKRILPDAATDMDDI